MTDTTQELHNDCDGFNCVACAQSEQKKAVEHVTQITDEALVRIAENAAVYSNCSYLDIAPMIARINADKAEIKRLNFVIDNLSQGYDDAESEACDAETKIMHLTEALKSLKKKFVDEAQDHTDECGRYDPETGQVDFSGDGEEYNGELYERAEEVGVIVDKAFEGSQS